MRYQKTIADGTTYQLVEPDYQGGADRCIELCTLDDGYTYVAIPAAITLPPQPKQITVEPVTMTAALKARIRAASPHYRLINERVVERIRERYSVNDEIKLSWQPPGPDVDTYRTYVAECVAEGLAEKARLGLD